MPDPQAPTTAATAVTVLDHPAAGALLATLRAQSTPAAGFRTAARRLGAMLATEATRAIPARSAAIRTPLATSRVDVPARPVVVVPVLRAGLGLLAGVQEVWPDAPVGMVGLERDESTLQPRRYYDKVPAVAGAWVLVLEPMLATGGSAAAAATLVAGDAEQVTVLSVVATSTAVARVLDAAPEARIVTAALDTELDERGYIVPGLGDFGDRLWATPPT